MFNNVSSSNNFVNYQYESHNNNNFNNNEKKEDFNNNITKNMVNDIIARNNLLIQQLTNDNNMGELNKDNINNYINENNNYNTENNNYINENNKLNQSGGALSDSGLGENQLSQMSNMTDRTKFLFKKTMDEYPPLEDDNFFNSIQSKN